MNYNWELEGWPVFPYNLTGVEKLLYEFVTDTGEMTGILKSLPKEIQEESLVQVMLYEAIKTFEIEGEILSRQDVMSSIPNNLGLNEKQEFIRDKNAQVVGELMVDVRKSYKETFYTSENDLL